MQRTRFYLGVFFLTLATLMLELVQTRILSVVLWYHLAFFVISIAMFGLTAGSVWVYLSGNRFTQSTLFSDLSYFSSAFALVTAVSLVVQMTLAPRVVTTVTSMVTWAELAVCLAAPFFFAGVAISTALTRSPFPIGRVYGVDLLGAAMGCLGVIALLNFTDGPSAMLWVAACAAVSALLFQGASKHETVRQPLPFGSVLRRPGLVLVVLVATACVNGVTQYGLQPLAIKGQFHELRSKLFEDWNSFSRVAVYSSGGGGAAERPRMWGPSPKTPFEQWSVQQRWMNIDGDAGTVMYGFGGDPEEVGFLKYDVTNLVYYLPDRESAAVIGVGGGRDLLSAWVFGLRDLTGVEINPIFVRLLTREPGYADFARIRDIDGIGLIVDEARSWMARSEREFDIIQMSLIDTWAATGAGAFTLSENGLYTVEAWETFLRRLTQRGAFSVSRWYGTGEVNETGRMVSLATAALLKLGVERPRDHILVAATDRVATLIVSRAAWSARDLEVLEATAAGLEYAVLISPDRAVDSEVLRNIVEASDLASLKRYTSSLPLDLTPPTDERPFFFNQLPLHRPAQAFRTALSWASGGWVPGVVQGNLIATATLLTLVLIALILVSVTIVIPLHPAVRDVGSALVVSGTVYFVLIGFGFMMIEIAALQTMSVFLGHPIYSLSAVLFTLILATGFGSLLSDRLVLDKRSKLAGWAVLTAGYTLSLLFWLPPLLHQLAGAQLGVRILVCILTIAPAGLLLGFGFPTGMRLVSAVDSRPTPWFWGINGAAGVLAGISAVVTSIAFGISVTFSIGALCYLLIIPAAFAAERAGRSA